MGVPPGAERKWPSKAASFAGWVEAILRACMSPETNIAARETVATSSATESALRAEPSCRRCSRCQAETLSTKKAPRMYDPSKTWTSRWTLDGLKTIAQKSTTSARGAPSWTTMRWPAGVFIQELATTIQIAEKLEPRATMQVETKCMRGPTRSQPYTKTARKPDSRKKAKMPSAARAEPNTSPANRENRPQLVPNWNSITIPVATPTTKLTAKIRVQNRARAW